jgi:hypothetical protein
LAQKTDNLQLCEKASPYARDGCYKLIAIKRQDSALCEQIAKNDSAAGYPRDICYTDIAIQKQDEALCEKVSTQVLPGVDFSKRDICYSGVAVAKVDVSLCDKVVSSTQKAVCNNLVK